MNFQNIFLIVIIILLLYLVVSFFYSAPQTTPLTSAETEQTVTITNLVNGASNNSNNTYAIWFYINDYTSIKAVNPNSAFVCSTQADIIPSGTVGTGQVGILYFQEGYIKAQFYTDNSLQIQIATTECTGATNNNYGVNIKNVPVQKWTQVIVTTTQSTIDCYIDGKLNYTINAPKLATCKTDKAIKITPTGRGFNGYTSMFQYLPNTINPQQAWDMYSLGYGNSMYNNIFGKYSIQISLLDNGNVQHSLTI
jgi:hypothetical protein